MVDSDNLVKVEDVLIEVRELVDKLIPELKGRGTANSDYWGTLVLNAKFLRKSLDQLIDGHDKDSNSFLSYM